MPKYFVLIPAGGNGARMAGPSPKQYGILNGQAVLLYGLKLFSAYEKITQIFVVVAPGDLAWQQLPALPKVTFLSCGGETRAQTVANGLAELSALVASDDWIIVHDAARPCLKRHHLEQLIDALADDPVGGLLAVPITDTLKRSDAAGRVLKTEARENIWAAQTPQMFRFGLLKGALANVSEGITDDSQAIENLGHAPKLVAADSSNLKITFPEDMTLAEQILGATPPTKMRIGQGFDVHAFADNRLCIIGGVSIPFHLGLAGHSDADVLLHAICDALLGAAGLGDIGIHFPDTDRRYQNINSRTLLTAVGELLKTNFYSVINIDATIIAQAPKMAPYVKHMVDNIASDLKIEAARVSVKATTTEHLGFTGREEGIAASAICLIEGAK